MKFKDLKVNDLLYSFDESNITYSKLTVLNSSPARMDPKVLGSQVVDVTVTGNVTLVFKAEDISATNKDTYYTTDFNSLINKIRSVSLSIQDKLSGVDKLKQDKKLCDNLLAELDPMIKERQKSEKRLTDLESKVNSISSDLTEMKELLKKSIKYEKRD